LAITRTVFTASNSPKSLPNYWVERADDEEGDTRLNSFSVPLRNIGLGAAKEVELNWSFPIEKVVFEVNNIAQRTLMPAYFKYENEILSLNSEELSASFSMWRNQKHDFVDYVLPASIDQTGVRIHIPAAYIDLVSALIFFSTKDKNFDSFPNIPILRLQLEYFDIGGDKQQASFDIELNICSISEGGGGISWIF
jgi:hypothetical protein